MISYIKGTLEAVEEDMIIVETGGIGYGIRVPLSLLEELPSLGSPVIVHTYFQVREDSMTLYPEALWGFCLLCGPTTCGRLL